MLLLLPGITPRRDTNQTLLSNLGHISNPLLFLCFPELFKADTPFLGHQRPGKKKIYIYPGLHGLAEHLTKKSERGKAPVIVLLKITLCGEVTNLEKLNLCS